MLLDTCALQTKQSSLNGTSTSQLQKRSALTNSWDDKFNMEFSHLRWKGKISARVKYGRGLMEACGFNSNIMKSCRVFRGTARLGNVLPYFCYYNVRIMNNEGFKLKPKFGSWTAWCVKSLVDVVHLSCLFSFLKTSPQIWGWIFSLTNVSRIQLKITCFLLLSGKRQKQSIIRHNDWYNTFNNEHISNS